MSRIDRCSMPLLSLIIMVVLGSFTSAVGATTAELQMNQSKQCIKCHKRNGKMFGVHANDALDQSCQSCHGEKGGHPRKATELIGFSAEFVAEPMAQTAACHKCHDVEALARADWTHDVHTNKVNCAGCHQLHLEEDPIIGITAVNRSQLCRSCHSAE